MPVVIVEIDLTVVRPDRHQDAEARRRQPQMERVGKVARRPEFLDQLLEKLRSSPRRQRKNRQAAHLHWRLARVDIQPGGVQRLDWFHVSPPDGFGRPCRSEEHTSELQSLMRISYAVFCLKKKT